MAALLFWCVIPPPMKRQQSGFWGGGNDKHLWKRFLSELVPSIWNHGRAASFSSF